MSKLRGACTQVLISTGAAAIAVVSAAVVYTKSFELFSGEYFGLWVIGTGTGAIDYKIELEQSYTVPTTEGSAETTLYQVTDEVSAQINDKVAHVLTVTPKPMAYGRFKITGLGSNPADCVLTAFKFIQE